MQRAVNTDKDIFKIGDAYYMCYQGVWFVGKTATGPWEVAQSVPQEIYQIPASSPAHHVTYVTIEDDDDDEWVTYAAAAGYAGMMVGWGCAMWGSGYYYPPYYGYGGYYPYYYGHFPTYGYSAWYNPWTGAYGRSAGVYGPYGGAGVGARYNPRTGTYARGAAAYGPYGARGVAQAYNPRTGTYAATRQGSNVYGSWGSTAVQRGDDWAKTNRYTNNRTGNTTRTVRTDEGAGVVRRGDQGGVAAGIGRQRLRRARRQRLSQGQQRHVAEIRQRQLEQHAESTEWRAAEPPTDRRDRPARGTRSQAQPPATVDRGTMDQLNRDSRARTRRRAALQRLRHLPGRQRHPQHGQLSPERRRRLPGRAAAPRAAAAGGGDDARLSGIAERTRHPGERQQRPFPASPGWSRTRRAARHGTARAPPAPQREVRRVHRVRHDARRAGPPRAAAERRGDRPRSPACRSRTPWS